MKVVTLAHYDAACRELELAKSVDEAKDLRDKAEAMRAYARQAKNKKAELYAAEIRIRAERKLGELLKKTEKAPAGRPKKSKNKSVVTNDQLSTATLNELGISKDLSAKSQRLAGVPDEIFEQKLGELRRTVEEEGKRVTTDLLKIGADKLREPKPKLQEARLELILPVAEFQKWSDEAKWEGIELPEWVRQQVNASVAMKAKPFLDIKPELQPTNGCRDLPPKGSKWGLRGWRYMINTYHREPTEAEFDLYQKNKL
ncbi:MAG TPA: hypothetical protein VMW38_17100 [Terriglobia bacterium]|nr:hypothetical protein [Terriglobia bacterium]